ncbi:hypothetical protein ARMSODRAFT_1086516 [Armillaria solidipes]|uniref:Uncharacterized protein n=1 Tax=Armillaria solidipes TaxID=1076256 RepID=A0A2H3BS42_9AGAR|nr:hypothetical protein ARMSODRAFT_1086516 [Armillaria solidipes]
MDFTTDCPTCGLPGRITTNRDKSRDSDASTLLRQERPLVEDDNLWTLQSITAFSSDITAIKQGLRRLQNLAVAMRVELDEIAAARRRYRSILAPIRRLPQEVLLAIFSLCRESYLGEDSLDPRKFPWFLGHVCHMWRDLVHSSPLLWSSVALMTRYTSHSIDMIRYHLERSGNVLLDVFIDGAFRCRPLALKAVDCVYSHSYRWRSAELRMDEKRFMSRTFPCLQSLRLFYFSRSLNQRFLDAPALRNVVLRSSPDTICLSPHITHVAYLYLLDVLDSRPLFAFPNLVECHVAQMKKSPSTSTVHHRSLRFLRIESPEILATLNFPALEYLDLPITKKNDVDITFSFLLRSQCSLKHLTIRDGPPKGVDVSSILTIQSVSLTHLFVVLDEENYHSICCMLSSTESSDILASHLQCIEVLFNGYCLLRDNFIRIIESRWLTTEKGLTRFQRLVIHTTGQYEANELMSSGNMRKMVREGLDVVIFEDFHQYRRRSWLDPLMAHTEEM